MLVTINIVNVYWENDISPIITEPYYQMQAYLWSIAATLHAINNCFYKRCKN